MVRVLVVLSAGILLASQAQAQMPPLPEERTHIYDYYKLEFLEDGYPGRRTHKGVVEHPIYGTYVITDYLRQYRKTNDPRYLQGAIKVGDAAIQRMDRLGDALVFYYEPETGLSVLPRHYSGLTQARYLDVFTSLWEATEDGKYRKAAEEVLNSLALSVEDGGVALETHGGLVIEEWPDRMMGNYTLNGWTTAMLLVRQYAERTGSENAQQLFEKNVKALKALLPLYDLPELANTRYRLSGSARIRVLATDTIEIQRASITIPGEGTFDFGETRSQWTNYFYTGRSGTKLDLHAVMSMISFPKENSFTFEIAAEQPTSIEVQIGVGEYNPSVIGLAPTRFSTIASFQLTAGENKVELSVPWKEASLVAYPTAFSKKIGGKFYNAYHFIHIKNLKLLAKETGEPLFSEYARKWEEYVSLWPTIPAYTAPDISLESMTPQQ